MPPRQNSGFDIICGHALVVAGGRGVSQIKGVWLYLYSVVDSLGQTINFLLSAQRDAGSAKRLFCKALAQPHTMNPRTITVDKNPAYPRTLAGMKRVGELWRFSRLRQRNT